MKKIDKAIKMLKELDLDNKEQDVINSIDDSNIILNIVVKEIK